MNLLKRTSENKGFTIVELIVVISLIGILFALGVIGYGQWMKKVAQNEVKNDLTGASSAMEDARNFSSGYPLSIPTSFKKSAGVNLTYKTVGGTATAYCLDASSTRDTSVVYYISSANKTPTAGTCP